MESLLEFFKTRRKTLNLSGIEQVLCLSSRALSAWVAGETAQPAADTLRKLEAWARLNGYTPPAKPAKVAAGASTTRNVAKPRGASVPYTDQLADEIIARDGLAPSLKKVWKSRGAIPGGRVAEGGVDASGALSDTDPEYQKKCKLKITTTLFSPCNNKMQSFLRR